MKNDYFIMYNPLTFNLMDIKEKNSITPYDLISYITCKNAEKLSFDTYLDYLVKDQNKHRETMIETFAMETYAAIYIGNQIAKTEKSSTVFHADDKRRTIKEIIIKQGEKPKAVFITAMSANFPTAVIDSIILNHGKIPVIIGGIHVSSSHKDTNNFIRKHCPNKNIIADVIGPGDKIVIKQIIDDINNNNLQKTYHGNISVGDKVWMPQKNVDYLPPLNLNSLKRIPAIGNFLAKNMKAIPVAPFLGCPFSCKFCSISSLPKNKRKFTIRSTDDIIDELSYHQNNKKKFESQMFIFLPDNLLLGEKYLNDIADKIISKNFNVNFITQISIEIASKEKLLKKLRLAGATHFFIGLESLDIRNLEFIQKNVVKDIKKSNLSVSKYYTQKIKIIQNHGISIHGAFIIGLPHDYFLSFEDNTTNNIIRFCIENHIGLQPGILTDLPGSKLFYESQNAGLSLYGKQGTMNYLLSLCLADISESNRKIPDALKNSQIALLSMGLESVRKIGSTKHALKNAFYMMAKSFANPTFQGKKSLQKRFLNSAYSFAAQLYAALYKDVGEKLGQSKNGIRGSFERLYEEECEENKKYFYNYVSQFLK